MMEQPILVMLSPLICAADYNCRNQAFTLIITIGQMGAAGQLVVITMLRQLTIRGGYLQKPRAVP